MNPKLERMLRMDNETKGVIFAVLTAIISGAAIITNKAFIVDMDPTVFTAVRAFFVGLIFLFLSLFTGKFDYVKLKAMPWKYLILIAVIGGSVAFLAFFSGLKLTTGGRAAFLHKTLPIYAAFFAWLLLREKISMKQTYAFLIMMLGMFVIFAAQINPAALWMDPLTGDALIVGATVLWALESVIARKAMLKGGTNYMVSFSRMFIGALILFGVVGITGNFGALLTLKPYQSMNLMASTLILFGYVFCWYFSIRFINVSKATMILLLAPVISLILGAAVLGEPVQALQILGSAMILAGAYFVLRIRSEFETGI